MRGWSMARIVRMYVWGVAHGRIGLAPRDAPAPGAVVGRKAFVRLHHCAVPLPVRCGRGASQISG